MYLYGASGHAKVIIDILRANNENVEALFDDNEAIHSLLGYPVLCSSEVRGPLIISIGSNSIRKKIAESLNVTFGKAFHPSAIISEESEISEGTVVMQGAIIQSDVRLGRHCIINTGAWVSFISDSSDIIAEGWKALPKVTFRLSAIFLRILLLPMLIISGPRTSEEHNTG